MTVESKVQEYAEEKAKKFSGNWQTFESFHWHDKPENPHLWTIIYTHGAASDLVTRSNAKVIDRELEIFSEDTCIHQHHSHYAVGWIDGYAIKVYTDDSRVELTPAFLAYSSLAYSLEGYPYLDESLLSEMEYQETVNNIREECCTLIKEDAPKNWPELIYSRLSELHPEMLESSDGEPAYPSGTHLWEVVAELGLTEVEKPNYRECRHCGTVEHFDYDCPCSCHLD